MNHDIMKRFCEKVNEARQQMEAELAAEPKPEWPTTFESFGQRLDREWEDAEGMGEHGAAEFCLRMFRAWVDEAEHVGGCSTARKLRARIDAMLNEGGAK